MQIQPGTKQSLPIFEITEQGYLLGDAEDNVFIPKREIRTKVEQGSEVEIFTFYNEERELEATTTLPAIEVGEIGCFRVINSGDIGAFINIGLRRDVLIPKKEQGDSLEVGKMSLVILCDDPENRRIYASTRLGRYLNNEDVTYQRGDEVSLVIAEKIDIGRRVVIDGKFTGALFNQEITDRIRLGEKVKGYVRKVEGKDITVSMQREGMELLDDSKVKIMAYLEMNGGYVRLNDDTDPEEIKLRLKMSKKTFKKAAGMLYKEGKVTLTKFGVKLNQEVEVPKVWVKDKFDDENEKDLQKLDKADKKEGYDLKEPRQRQRTPVETKGWKVKEPAFMANKRARISSGDEKGEQAEKPVNDEKTVLKTGKPALKESKPVTKSEKPALSDAKLIEKSEAPITKEKTEPSKPQPAKQIDDEPKPTPAKRELTFKGKK